MAETGFENPYSKFFLTNHTSKLGFTTEGGSITQWSVQNPQEETVQLLYVGKSLKRTGIPLMFPNFGPSGGKLPQHGFSRNTRWQLLTHSTERADMQMTEKDLDNETKLLYPHLFQANIKLALLNGNALDYKLAVTNTGDKPLPIAPGLHPYWSTPMDQKVQVETLGIPGFDAGTVDWKRTPPDTIYNFNKNATIVMKDKTLTIKDCSQGDEAITKLVVWSQPEGSEDCEFICFEPVTRADGALKDNPIWVQPGQLWQMHLRFGVTFPINKAA